MCLDFYVVVRKCPVVFLIFYECSILALSAFSVYFCILSSMSLGGPCSGQVWRDILIFYWLKILDDIGQDPMRFYLFVLHLCIGISVLSLLLAGSHS